jgi:hypothetical protein
MATPAAPAAPASDGGIEDLPTYVHYRFCFEFHVSKGCNLSVTVLAWK